MNLKICGQSTKSNYKNSGSSARAVFYDEHDLREYLDEALKLGAQDKQMRFFDMEGHIVTAAEVMEKIDRHHLGLHKDEAKFFCIMLDPSDPEIAAMGADLTERLANGQQYVFDIMDAYAKNFHRNGIDDRHNLTAYAITNLYKGKEKKDQLHWHIIVAKKDASNKYKLSPLTNHRSTTKGVVKGGFDRIAFDKECERLFDERFGYNRRVEESFDYCLAQKKGTPEQKAEQTQRLADQNKPDLEAAVNAFLNQRVAQLAAEAAARAEKERQEQEEAAKEEAARIESIKRNQFWNAYNSYYKPLISTAKNSCNKTFNLFDKYKKLDKKISHEISSQYNLLRTQYAEMDRLETDIQTALTAKGILTAVAALITCLNPVVGIAIGLVGRIVAEANRNESIAAKKEIRAEAAVIRDDIETLKEKQRQLRQNKADSLRAYVEAKEDKEGLFLEMNNLRNELLGSTERMEAAFDFKEALQQINDIHSSGIHSRQRTFSDVVSIIKTARNKETLLAELNKRNLVINPKTTHDGVVTDLSVVDSGAGAFDLKDLIPSIEFRALLERWTNLTSPPTEKEKQPQEHPDGMQISNVKIRF